VREFAFILYDPKKLVAAVLATFIVMPISLVLLVRTNVSAMNQPVSPYTGGASVSKVFYPADGSTITVTCTGAVVKQSPGGTAYRQGWINPATVNDTSSFNDLRGHIMSGSVNPYGNSNTSCNNSSHTTMTQSSPQQPVTYTKTKTTKNVTNTNNNYYAQPANNQSYQPSQPAVQSYNTTSTKIPNTGAGSVLALGGISTVLGTFGHLFYQRRRFRSTL
jgi:hypothetical protein